jgi:hypothetical protein
MKPETQEFKNAVLTALAPIGDFTADVDAMWDHKVKEEVVDITKHSTLNLYIAEVVVDRMQILEAQTDAVKTPVRSSLGIIAMTMGGDLELLDQARAAILEATTPRTGQQISADIPGLPPMPKPLTEL